MQIVRQETRQDAAGSYIAYVYADGHVETDPAGRPLTKEDLQRQRRTEIAQAQTLQALAADRARFGIVLEPNAVQRDKAVTVSAKVATKDYSTFLHAVSELSGTSTTPAMKGGPVDQALTSVSIGGDVVGAPKYRAPSDLGKADQSIPAELKTEVR